MYLYNLILIVVDNGIVLLLSRTIADRKLVLS